jgi:hypothetical protein
MTKVGASVSVVMATLGGDQLHETIAHLNAGIIKPFEILICIPQNYISKVNQIQDPNVRLIPTKCMGQVAQRVEGFKLASRDLVMQMDDDVKLKVDTLQKMISTLQLLGKKNVVGPVYLNNKNGMSLSPYPLGIRGVFTNIFYYLFGGLPFGKARMGCLSSVCVSSSIDPQFYEENFVRTEWLAGGCVLSYREDLISENFYPFKGKAYAEDGLHSYLRSKIGINHNVVLGAHALIDVPSNSFKFQDFVREMYARVKIVKIMKGSIVRKFIYILAEYVRRMLWDIRQRWKLNKWC